MTKDLYQWLLERHLTDLFIDLFALLILWEKRPHLHCRSEFTKIRLAQLQVKRLLIESEVSHECLQKCADIAFPISKMKADIDYMVPSSETDQDRGFSVEWALNIDLE